MFKWLIGTRKRAERKRGALIRSLPTGWNGDPEYWPRTSPGWRIQEELFKVQCCIDKKKKNPMGEWWRRMREKVKPSAKVYSRKRKWKE